MSGNIVRCVKSTPCVMKHFCCVLVTLLCFGPVLCLCLRVQKIMSPTMWPPTIQYTITESIRHNKAHDLLPAAAVVVVAATASSVVVVVNPDRCDGNFVGRAWAHALLFLATTATRRIIAALLERDAATHFHRGAHGFAFSHCDRDDAAQRCLENEPLTRLHTLLSVSQLVLLSYSIIVGGL